MEARQPGKLELILATASMAAMLWYTIPPQERYWVKLRAVQTLHRLSGRAARREGRQGMSDELSGKDPKPHYGGAYIMSRVRDVLGKTLEGMKP